MNIEYLKYFITVSEMGSINKAAQALFISQPHLGNIIHSLEEEAGTVLFRRTRHGVTLTAEGSEFLVHANRILEEYGHIHKTDDTLTRSYLSLEVSMVKFSHIMESFIDVVLKHQNDPQFSHQLNEGSSEDVIEDIYNGMFGIGVLNFDSQRRKYFLTKLASKHLTYHPLAKLLPCILISNDHPLLQDTEPVTLQRLENYVFVRYTGQYEDFSNRITCEQGIQNLNRSRRIIYVQGRSTLLHLIGNSDFYGIGIRDFSMQESAYNVRSIPIEDCSAPLEFGYILQEGRKVSPIMEEFIENLTSRFAGFFTE